jgi:hypothetical protein
MGKAFQHIPTSIFLLDCFVIKNKNPVLRIRNECFADKQHYFVIFVF